MVGHQNAGIGKLSLARCKAERNEVFTLERFVQPVIVGCFKDIEAVCFDIVFGDKLVKMSFSTLSLKAL